ncbi:MAG: hypothetical protein ABH841_00865 [Candidatus Nealsonbacteria bacterium]
MALLRIFSKKDVRYVPYELPLNSRLDFAELLKLDFTQTLLVYKDIPFNINIGRSENIFKKDGEFYRQRVCEGFRELELSFLDKESQECQSIKYISIDIDPEMIPQSLIDVVFFHELREMYFQIAFKIIRRTAHCKAVKGEKVYVNRFLLLSERKLHRKFRKESRMIIEKVL